MRDQLISTYLAEKREICHRHWAEQQQQIFSVEAQLSKNDDDDDDFLSQGLKIGRT